jgi:hypothetical protein
VLPPHRPGWGQRRSRSRSQLPFASDGIPHGGCRRLGVNSAKEKNAGVRNVGQGPLSSKACRFLLVVPIRLGKRCFDLREPALSFGTVHMLRLRQRFRSEMASFLRTGWQLR